MNSLEHEFQSEPYLTVIYYTQHEDLELFSCDNMNDKDPKNHTFFSVKGGMEEKNLV